MASKVPALRRTPHALRDYVPKAPEERTKFDPKPKIKPPIPDVKIFAPRPTEEKPKESNSATSVDNPPKKPRSPFSRRWLAPGRILAP